MHDTGKKYIEKKKNKEKERSGIKLSKMSDPIKMKSMTYKDFLQVDITLIRYQHFHLQYTFLAFSNITLFQMFQTFYSILNPSAIHS